ncbi:hypothetical protein [Cupriavidus sp. DF5525]|uniref:hypothetical protein n=1 Tax=Cupriavidus sp. DF5525 TaxID=3160989 RepID=UPI0035A94230
MRAKRRSRNDPLLAAALLALNSQRKQGGGRSNLVICQACAWQIAILFDGLSWVDWAGDEGPF